jgi:hypothetical protein
MLQDDATDLYLLQLADEDMDSSLQALGLFLYHMEDDGPLGPMETGHSTSSRPSEQREGPKRQRDDEKQSGSGGPAPKRCHLVASR